MKIFNLAEKSSIYSSNAYLIIGDWNTLDDVNTLIDTGRSPEVIKRLFQINTGVGKKRIDQILLTHNHYDHTGHLQELEGLFNPRILAFSKNLKVKSEQLRDYKKLRVADREFEVIHIAGHSSDSLCFYCEQEGVLFSGDAPVNSFNIDITCEEDFKQSLLRLTRKRVNIIYPGHGEPIRENCNELLKKIYENCFKKNKKAI
jgi:glyoxylase-like metal-dependent hydrolase (beta-lactamase superfamily II)